MELGWRVELGWRTRCFITAKVLALLVQSTKVRLLTGRAAQGAGGGAAPPAIAVGAPNIDVTLVAHSMGAAGITVAATVAATVCGRISHCCMRA